MKQIILTVIVVFVFLTGCENRQNLSNNKTESEKLKIIVKFEKEFTNSDSRIIYPNEFKDRELSNIFRDFNINELFPVFKNRYNNLGYIKPEIQKDGLELYRQFLLYDKSIADDFISKAQSTKGIDIAYIEEDVMIKPCVAPNDTEYSDQWHLNSTINPFADIDAEAAWDINTGRHDVIIAVCDGGINYLHQDLDPGDRSRIIAGYDAADNDNDPMDDLPDWTDGSYAGHGTNIAGIIGAIANNTNQVSGVMWNCQIMPVKMVGSGSLSIDYMPFSTNSFNWDFSTTAFPSDVADAIDYAVNHGAHVINLSYGFPSKGLFINDVILKVPLLYDAISNAYNNNVVVVVSMGNSHEDGNPTNYPAAFSHEVIAVGATNENPLVRRQTSSTGSHINVCAPGTDILTTDRTGNPDTHSGTSMAAPIVCGVSGLIISQGLDRGFNLTNDDVRHILEITADDIVAYGIGFDEDTGHGKVNAYRALELLDEPNILVHGTSLGGQYTKQNLDRWEFIGNRWGLAAGIYYDVDRYEITKHIEFDVPFCNAPTIWIRDRECISMHFGSPNDGFPWAEISNVTETGFDVRFASYYIRYNSSGQSVNKYLPASPSSTRIEYTAVGRPNLAATAGSLTDVDYVCTNNKTFNLQNIPAGTNVAWSKSSNLTYINGQGTANYTVRAINSTTKGTGWVKATLNTGCGNFVYEENFWIGRPETPTIICPHSKVGMNSLVEVQSMSGGAANYTWSLGGGTIVNGQGTNEILLRTSSSCLYDLTIRLTTNNACGSSVQTQKTIPYDCSGGVTPLSLSPNPTNTILNVKFDEQLLTENSVDAFLSTAEELLVTITNQYLMPVYKKRYKSKQFSINMSSFPTGIYYLQIVKGNKMYSEKVIISR